MTITNYRCEGVCYSAFAPSSSLTRCSVCAPVQTIEQTVVLRCLRGTKQVNKVVFFHSQILRNRSKLAEFWEKIFWKKISSHFLVEKKSMSLFSQKKKSFPPFHFFLNSLIYSYENQFMYFFMSYTPMNTPESLNPTWFTF